MTFSKVMGDKHDTADHTIYGSDHYPLIADFEFTLAKPCITAQIDLTGISLTHLSQQ